MRVTSQAIAVIFITCSISVACSPLYVLQAGWEETKILARREKIEALVSELETPQELREKLELVLKARDLSADVGLHPKQSFTTYTDIKRDTLVWVLSACPKTKLTPHTWWFPFVGRVPYKGYFDKDDGLLDAKKFEALNYDYDLRPSPAFSTLGWFNDPLLSTVTSYPKHILVETVIHEILHNTVWVKNQTGFNETLASFVGARGALELFLSASPEQAQLVKDEWHDSLLYGEHLSNTYKLLIEALAQQGQPPELSEPQLIEKRNEVYRKAHEIWKKQEPRLLSPRYRSMRPIQNNARLIAQKTYYEHPEIFECFYQHLNRSLPRFISEIKIIADQASDSTGHDAFELVKKRIAELPLLCDFADKDNVYSAIVESCPCTAAWSVAKKNTSSTELISVIPYPNAKVCNSCYTFVHKWTSGR